MASSVSSSPKDIPSRGLGRAATLSPLPAIAELGDLPFKNIPVALTRNRSTGNLLSTLDRIDPERASRIPDGDRSGLLRIRQPSSGGPPRRAGLPARSTSHYGSFPSVRSHSQISSASTEDLSRFPSESLHSFSFSRQSSALDLTRRHTARRTFDRFQSRRDASPNSSSDAFGTNSTTSPQLKSPPCRTDSSPSISDTFSPSTLPSHDGLSPLILNDPCKPSPDSSSYLDHHDQQLGHQPLTLVSTRAFSYGNITDLALSLSPIGPDPSIGIHSFSLAPPTQDPLASTYHRHAFPPRADSFDSIDLPKLKSTQSFPNLSLGAYSVLASAVSHGHGPRSLPSRQAILATEASYPWTIQSANDQASLLFGITEAGVRKVEALELIQPHRREWLKDMLADSCSTTPSLDSLHDLRSSSVEPPSSRSSDSGDSAPAPLKKPSIFGSGITARLLSKPRPSVSRQLQKLAHENAKVYAPTPTVSPSVLRTTGKVGHQKVGSRGVLVCGDVVPIHKANGEVGSATLWIKEKHGGLIWVLEEVTEHVAIVSIDEVGCIDQSWGGSKAIWDMDRVRPGIDARKLIPALPKEARTSTGRLDWAAIQQSQFFAARTADDVSVPVTVELLSPYMASAIMATSPTMFAGRPVHPDCHQLLRISSFPDIAGIMVLNAKTLVVSSSNTAFSGSLFGRRSLAGLHVNELIPNFDRLLRIILDDLDDEIVEGVSIPSHSFRSASAVLAFGDDGTGITDSAAAILLGPPSIEAHHRDGAQILVDIQMRVVKSERGAALVMPGTNAALWDSAGASESPELVYALWIAYSRDIHVNATKKRSSLPLTNKSPNLQSKPWNSPKEGSSSNETSPVIPSLSSPKRGQDRMSDHDGLHLVYPRKSTSARSTNRYAKKSINEFSVLEDMGQGAYGQVKLCRENATDRQVIIKYVTKKHILMDTWTRDRRLGTVPSEIHILDFLNQDGMNHPNIVKMLDFFEDDMHYYIEMLPHGVPGIDLFDYIEIPVNMTEAECRRMFVQVARAVDHLHNTAQVVHRDIKDENVILDGAGNIKLIDFGSAAYVKNGPFDVFVGTIDYAAPEVLEGRPYNGKEQDVWALGILLYTIVYKENPFYSVDEIMDHDLRVPYILSEDSIDVIRLMLNRDISKRATIREVLDHRWFQSEQ